MSRSGYSDDAENVAMWRGQVASAIRGKRGQLFLRELVQALDAMPDKRLIRHDLMVTPASLYGPPTRSEFYRARPDIEECGVCAIGSLGIARGVDLMSLDPEDYDALADTFGIAHQLVQEVEFMNDEFVWKEDPEARWQRMRDWAASNLKPRQGDRP